MFLILDSTPLVMVVGGYSNYKELKDLSNKCVKDESGKCMKESGLIKDVEVLNLSAEGSLQQRQKRNKICSKFVKYVYGQDYLLGEDENGHAIIVNEADVLGLTGVFSKGAAIVCGGKNRDKNLNICWEWNSEINR